ncbi:auxin-responsive protein SAUR71 [Brachypodium distachyon]|uniref:Uncharacterized protein n=1 Tax=Brachypodium distachyon TaxID=15368 RepID=I1GPT6_BRADI|nr:auxin-responsive protein SAUR71 [Brachypodium distachyon]KQK13886.1 hypothetical protein BRADI_1g13140v3 [Brachypodium distachyon]|eukprot:XP_003559616.1 auxin-responsive protein SAUR71 [Brachypodium distachyon]
MRQLIRRLSRVGDDSSSPPPSPGRKQRRGGKAVAAPVPEGHVPVHVGDGSEAERFLVRAELLGRPALAELLGRAAQEYGYHHQGPLRIPCSPDAFRAALASVAAAGDCR